MCMFVPYLSTQRQSVRYTRREWNVENFKASHCRKRLSDCWFWNVPKFVWISESDSVSDCQNSFYGIIVWYCIVDCAYGGRDEGIGSRDEGWMTKGWGQNSGLWRDGWKTGGTRGVGSGGAVSSCTLIWTEPSVVPVCKDLKLLRYFLCGNVMFKVLSTTSMTTGFPAWCLCWVSSVPGSWIVSAGLWTPICPGCLDLSC